MSIYLECVYFWLALLLRTDAHTLSHSHTADEKLLKAGNLHAATLCSIFILMPNPVWVKFACVCAKFQANRIFTAALFVFLPKVCTVYSPVTQQQLPATASPNCLHVISNREKKLTKNVNKINERLFKFWAKFSFLFSRTGLIALFFLDYTKTLAIKLRNLMHSIWVH